MKPPKRAIQFLRWFCREDYVEEIEGDLTELFVKQYPDSSWKAKWKFTWCVIKYFRPGFVKSFTQRQSFFSMDMFSNYFKISWRNLLRQKLYSFINIGGLSIGLTCFILIALFVQHEFSFDRSYIKAEQIYHVYQRQEGNAFMGADYFAVTPVQLADNLRTEFPEVIAATSIQTPSALITSGDSHFWQKGISADYQFLDVFGISLLQGNPKTALSGTSSSIILTTSLAKKIFGDEDAIGKTLYYNKDRAYAVTGIVADPPSNASLQFSFIINIMSDPWYMEEYNRSGWHGNSANTFVRLADGADPRLMEKKFPSFIQKHRNPESYANYPFKDTYFVRPLTAMHLMSGVNFDIGVKGSKRSVYLFAGIAFIVVLLACVNYMNLAIARSVRRAREVGLRKVSGAIRSQIIGQFLGESVMIAFLSLVIAVALAYLLLPAFGNLMERKIEFDPVTSAWMIPSLAGLVFVVGVFSGSYPAWVMSSLRPIQVLKSTAEGIKTRFSLQQILVVVQYTASIALVISSLVIFQQMKFIRDKDPGYNKHGVLSMQMRDHQVIKDFESLVSEWTQNPHVIAATQSSTLPIEIESSQIINDEPGSPEEDDLAVYNWRTGYDFATVFGIEVIAGRTFSREFKEDEKQYIINETAAKALGWTAEEAVGKQFWNDGDKTIIGVVKDFHMHTMHMPIMPLMIELSGEWASYVSVKVEPDELPATIEFLEKSVKKRSSYPFEYRFLDDRFNELYGTETRIAQIFGYFTLISIVIASLGLFGLAAFVSGQRVKEIGVRKVLGASSGSIMVLLTKDFLKLVLIAFAISVPIGWYAMHTWLQDFAYRTELSWWIFAVAGIMAAVMAYLSIGYQSLRTSQMNPVDTLKND